MSLTLRLFLSFPILLLSMYVLKSSAVEPYIGLICHLLAYVTYSIVHIFDSNIVLDQVTIYLGTVEYGIMVVPACSALDIYLTLASLVLLEKVSFATKLKTIILGFIVIQSVNILRLCILFYARVYTLPPTYRVIHETYFPVFLVIISVLLYCCWLSRVDMANRLSQSLDKVENVVQGKTNAAACALLSIMLFIAWNWLIEPYTKYMLYLPSKVAIETGMTNWHNEVELHGSENKLIITNRTFSSPIPIKEINQQKKMALSNQYHVMADTKGAGLLMLPLLLSILLINSRSIGGLIAVLLIPIVLVSVHFSLQYHSTVIAMLENLKFPAVLTYQGQAIVAEYYSQSIGLLLKHLDSALTYFSLILVPIYYWRKTVTKPPLINKIN